MHVARSASGLRTFLAAASISSFALVAGGCSDSLDRGTLAAADRGEFGAGRVKLQASLTDDRSDRGYILDRLRLMILTLADGQPDAAEQTANELFSLLSTQGVNADKTVSAAVINERVKIWKGEPFEQAMAYAYVSMQKAERGEWDNARAAAANSLFLLKDFRDNEQRQSGAELTSEDLTRAAATRDARQSGSGDAYLDHGYVTAKTDFALGYLLTAIAARSLARNEEAADNFRAAAEANAGIAPLCELLEKGTYNTVLVVDYGRGPRKEAYGPDRALSRFAPCRFSDGRGIDVSLVDADGSRSTSTFPWVTDVNAMSQSHMWNNLEDVRQAKSLIGSALVIGGASVAIASDNRDAQLAGLIAIGVGALLKASASADTRHCELLPQRVYVVPLNITREGSRVTLVPAGDPASTLTLCDLAPPRAGTQFRYVRVPNSGPQPWATDGGVVYSNDRRTNGSGRLQGDDLPFIMGGRCVSSPTPAVMDRYHAAGNLSDLTASDLENLYREEGIALSVEEQKGGSRSHVLEGGDSLVAPLPGTTGYQRLFGQIHRPWQPRSAALRDYLEKHAAPQPAPQKGN